MNTTIKFGGFYHSIHSAVIENSIDSYIEYMNDENNTDKNENDYNFDYSAMYQDYINQFIPILENHIKDNYNIDIKFSNQYLWSPKEYNFATDEIIADINKPYTLIDTFKANKDFLEYLKDSTKSYDGYISYYSYDSALNNKNDILPVYILSYIINKWYNSDSFYYDVADSIYIDIIEKTPCNA